MWPWRLLDITSQNAFMNMATDEALLRALIRKKTTKPSLRFYTWLHPALSIGCLQKSYGNIDLTQCPKLGLDMVRRPTGGRIVLHKGDLTFSLVFAENNPAIPGGILPSYQKIGQAIQQGFLSLGIPVQLCPKRNINRSPFCFSIAAKYEILVHGKKIMGNAQKREKGVVLHQGSIMIQNHRTLIRRLFPSSPSPSPGRDIVDRDTIQTKEAEFISLSEVLNGPASVTRLKDALIKGFEKTLSISLTTGSLTEWEEDEAIRLCNEKYSLDRWNKEGRL